MRPSCREMIRCTVTRPIPVPSNSESRCSRRNGSKSLWAYAISNPAPLSRTQKTASFQIYLDDVFACGEAARGTGRGRNRRRGEVTFHLHRQIEATRPLQQTVSEMIHPPENSPFVSKPCVPQITAVRDMRLDDIPVDVLPPCRAMVTLRTGFKPRIPVTGRFFGESNI